jgi:hypothetical protein
MSEFLELSDTVILRMLKRRTQGESITADDALAATRLRGRLSSESFSVLEQLVTSRLRGRTSSDVAVITDQTPRAILRNRILLDLISMDDGFIKMLRKVLTMTDLVSLVDVVTSNTTGIRVVTTTEAVAVLDQVVRGIERNRRAQDLTVMAEATLRSVYRLALREEALSMDDLTAMARSLRRDFVEFLTLTDAAIVAYGFYIIHETRIRLGYEDPVTIGVCYDGMPIVGSADDDIILGGYNPA